MHININVKLTIKIILIFMIAFVFLPMFTISCGDKSSNISIVDGVTGTYDEYLDQDTIETLKLISEFVIYLPIICLIIAFIKVIPNKIESIIGIIMMVLDFILNINYRKFIESFATANGCSSDVKFTYYLYLLMNFGVIVAYVMNFKNYKAIHQFDSKKMFTNMLTNNHEWVCSCGKKNATSHLFCSACGKKKPEESTERNWTCSCGFENKAEGIFCGACGKSRKDNERISENVLPNGAWKCTNCGNVLQNEDNFCDICGTRKL